MTVDLSILVPAFSRVVSASITADIFQRDRRLVEQLLADVARVQGLAESVRLASTSRLHDLAEHGTTPEPETTISDLGRTSQRDASQT